MNLIKKIFFKRKPVLNLDEQLQQEIYNNDKSIFEYEKEIHKIRGWAMDLLHKNFEVPKSLWYEELENLEKIMGFKTLTTLNEEEIQDIYKIANSYKQQIDLRKMKVEACKKNIIQIRKMIAEESHIKQELNKTDFSFDQLEMHKNKIHELDNTDITEEIIKAEKIKILKQQIEELYDELKLKKETFEQLKILNKKYGQSDDFKTNEVYLEELKKLFIKNKLIYFQK